MNDIKKSAAPGSFASAGTDPTKTVSHALRIKIAFFCIASMLVSFFRGLV